VLWAHLFHVMCHDLHVINSFSHSNTGPRKLTSTVHFVMKLIEYEAIVTVAHQIMHKKDCIKTLQKEFSGYFPVSAFSRTKMINCYFFLFPRVPEETLVSIYAQLYQVRSEASYIIVLYRPKKFFVILCPPLPFPKQNAL